jgi:hypothetical protein
MRRIDNRDVIVFRGCEYDGTLLAIIYATDRSLN